eukprot:SRR837773.21034.p2 GENE.SRR837773.21034~~SRR837773.21034.p2  ORF type:complete len:250 (-),score=78.74 SRR837773.21034:24-695(-)
MNEGAVARMRVAVMAQGTSQAFLEAYEDLMPEARAVLDVELARTGLAQQSYSGRPGNAEGGPAFLVYYAPAMLNRNHTDASGALYVLAEVLKQARALWPVVHGVEVETVTIMVDALKELSVESMLQMKPGEIWALHRVTSKSAQVKKLSMLKDQDALDWATMRVLTLSSASSEANVVHSRSSILHGEQPVCGLAPLDGDPPDLREVSSAGACSGCCFGFGFCA